MWNIFLMHLLNDKVKDGGSSISQEIHIQIPNKNRGRHHSQALLE